MAEPFDLAKFYGDTLANTAQGIPGALKQMTDAQREGIAMQRRAYDDFRGALSQTDGVNLPMMQFSAALGAPTRGGLGGALASGMSAYAGALQQQRDDNLSKAEKLMRLQEGLAKLRGEEGSLAWNNIDRTLGAAEKISGIGALSADADYMRNRSGLMSTSSASTPTAASATSATPATPATSIAATAATSAGGLPPLPPPNVEEAANRAAATGQVANTPRAALPPAATVPAQAATSTEMDASQRRLQQYRAAIANAQQYGRSAAAQKDIERFEKLMEKEPAFVMEQEMAKKGYRPEGGSFTPQPGTPAAREVEEQQRKDKEAAALKMGQGDTMLDTLNDIEKSMKSAWLPTAGAGAGFVSHIPGTAASDIAANLETLKSLSSFSTLQKMRESSPTGGALGAVSDTEQKMLAAAYASLSQSQSPDQFRRNLNNFRQRYLETIHGKEAAQQMIAAYNSRTATAGRGESSPQKSEIPAAAIDRLRQMDSPQARQQFDEIFGAGAAARALGSR